MAKVVPLPHIAKAFNDARAIGTPDAAFARDNIVDFERHRISRVYRRMCAELDRHPVDLDGWLARGRVEPEPQPQRIPAWEWLAVCLAFGAICFGLAVL